MYYYDRHVVHNGGVIENLEDQKTEKYEVKPYYMTAFALGAMRTLINIGNQLAPTLSRSIRVQSFVCDFFFSLSLSFFPSSFILKEQKF